jgi:hypothetical protein
LRFADYEKKVLEASFSKLAREEYKEHKRGIYKSIFLFFPLSLVGFYLYSINYNMFTEANVASVSEQIYYSSMFNLTQGVLILIFSLIYLVSSIRGLGAVYEATYRELNSKYL